MDLLFNAIKGQFNTLNFVLLLLISAFILARTKKATVSKLLFALCFFIFIICSTGYLPMYLVGRIENRYSPFIKSGHSFEKDTVYVYVLGGGYIADQRLTALGQLSYTSMMRLTEGIRVVQMFKQGILVLSGTVASGNESLASVERRAAISLGLDSTRTIILDKANTTLQEVEAFDQRFGKSAEVIVVTDAVHMTRALNFFFSKGIRPVPAPTNYLIRKDNNPINLQWLPSIENMQLMDRIFREWLGSIKGYLLGTMLNV